MSRLTKILLVLIVLSGCAGLQYLIDDGAGTGWPQNSLRNWQEFGFFQLHGKLVTNPGGFEATTHPDIYPGMSPVCLYPALAATQLFAWTGLSTLSFQILLALVVFWAIRDLLGRNQFAFAVAGVAILCPGYGRWIYLLDPNTISVLLGLPYVAIVIFIFKRPQPGLIAVGGLFLLTLAFLSLNWTTIWVIGPLALLLLGLPAIKRRTTLLFIGLFGVGSLLFAAASVIIKSSPDHAGKGNLVLFLQGYTWGNVGYGSGLTTSIAFTRLAFVNGVGLLPLLLIAGWAAKKYFQRDDFKSWFALSPFALMVMEIGFMRNYFGHHPWMAAPVLLVGIIFSLVLLQTRDETSIPISGWETRCFLIPVVIVLCLIYGFAVMMFFQANGTNERLMVNFVRHQTGRSDCIVVVKNLDPQTALIADRLDEMLDRHVVVIDKLEELPADESHAIILSAMQIGNGLPLRAQEIASPSSLQKVADWFNHSIARRRPGDRLDFSGTYYLYETRP